MVYDKEHKEDNVGIVTIVEINPFACNVVVFHKIVCEKALYIEWKVVKINLLHVTILLCAAVCPE